ncbi:MAG TPA: M14 family zinc carboxypeptidase [Sedimentisphaerales bacterium]|nr:M14 family zinc carboxypeptidase [Sedimentisphaerales bacterium]
MKRQRPIVLLLCMLLACLFAGGCREPAGGPVIVDVAPTTVIARSYTVGRSVQDRPIECFVLGQGRDVTFILAAIHGDEPAGTLLLQQLGRYLRKQPQLLDGRKVVLLPVANPDGAAQNNRLNSRGVDLNRNFPGVNRIDSELYGYSALSEPEARVIKRIIKQYAPDRIVSIHQLTETGPEALSSHLPRGCIDYDGPAKAVAEKMVSHCDLPIEKLGACPGSLGSYAGLKLGIPVITLELPVNAHVVDSDRLWESYGTALVAAIVYPASVM